MLLLWASSRVQSAIPGNRDDSSSKSTRCEQHIRTRRRHVTASGGAWHAEGVGRCWLSPGPPGHRPCPGGRTRVLPSLSQTCGPTAPLSLPGSGAWTRPSKVGPWLCVLCAFRAQKGREAVMQVGFLKVRGRPPGSSSLLAEASRSLGKTQRDRSAGRPGSPPGNHGVVSAILGGAREPDSSGPARATASPERPWARCREAPEGTTDEADGRPSN